MSLDYCIDSTKIWLKGNFSPYGTNVYVIKKESGFAPNGSKVFDFYEPFDTLTGTVWTTICGTPDAMSGKLSLINTTSAEGVQSIQTFSCGTYGVYMEIRMQRGDATTYAGLSSSSTQWATWVVDTTDAVHTGNDSAYTRVNDLSRTPNTMYTYGIGWTKTAVAFFVDYNLRQTVTTNLPTANKMPIEILGNAGVYSFVDWVRIRKYIDTEPTVVVVDEGTEYKIIVKNNMDKWLNNFQFAINTTDIGVGSQTESLNIIPMLTASDIYSDLFNSNQFYYNVFPTGMSGYIGTDRFGIHRGLLCDGTQNSFTLSPIDISSDFTIFVIYKTTSTNTMYFLSKRGESDLRGFDCYTTSGKPYFSIDSGDTMYTVHSDTVYTNSFVYYGATRKSAEMQLYINGTLDKTTTVSTNDLTNSSYTRIGTSNSQTNNFNGNIDCVIMWNRALSVDEHKLLYDLFKMKYVRPYLNAATTTNTQQKGY